MIGKKLELKEVIERFKKVHGDRYDYSLVEYKNNLTNVKIICSVHGIFEQNPQTHYYGSNCPYCLKVKTNNKEIIERFKKIHGDKYDYNLVDYKNYKTKVKIICSIHGVFEQLPSQHSRGQGCPKCSNNCPLTNEEFIKRSNIIHNNKYDYSLVNYNRARKKIKIICKKHGIFEQCPNDHLCKKGCPKCNTSKGELRIIKILNFYNIEFEYQKRFNKCKYKNTLPFDFYLTNYNICIEYDGKHHFEIVEKWGGTKEFEIIQKRDIIKTEYCKNNNIELIRIKYTDNIKEKLNFLNKKSEK